MLLLVIDKTGVIMKKKLDAIISEFLRKNDINPGTIAVPVGALVKAIQDSNPGMPISKTAVGRRLTGIFAKKQGYYVNQDSVEVTQCYFLDKKL
ncbi:MAG: hypothetical protein ACKOWO_08005 [Sediminibacterium sp.]